MVLQNVFESSTDEGAVEVDECVDFDTGLCSGLDGELSALASGPETTVSSADGRIYTQEDKTIAQKAATHQ